MPTTKPGKVVGCAVNMSAHLLLTTEGMQEQAWHVLSQDRIVGSRAKTALMQALDARDPTLKRGLHLHLCYIFQSVNLVCYALHLRSRQICIDLHLNLYHVRHSGIPACTVPLISDIRLEDPLFWQEFC